VGGTDGRSCGLGRGLAHPPAHRLRIDSQAHLAVVERVYDPNSPVKDPAAQKEILAIRHHSLFAPRDFDISPYFSIVKPTIEAGFDYTQIPWAGPVEEAA